MINIKVRIWGSSKLIGFLVGPHIYKISLLSVLVRNQEGAEKIIKIIDIINYKRTKQITITVKKDKGLGESELKQSK